MGIYMYTQTNTHTHGCLRRLTNSCVKRSSEKQMRKVKVYPFECRVTKKRKER